MCHDDSVRHPRRPDHPAGGVHAAARGQPGGLPARVRGEGAAGPAQPASAPARGSSTFDEAEREVAAGPTGRRLPRLRPRRRARADGAAARHGPGLPESRFVVADTLVRFDHAASVAEVLAGDPASVSERLAADVAAEPPAAGVRARPDAALPRRGEAYEAGVRTREGAHPGRRRVPDRPLAAGGAPDRRLRARALPLAPPHQPLALPLPARAGRRLARRLLAGDAGQARRHARVPQPDRRDDDARRGRRGGAARLREGQGRARDARRPRPQRPLARVRARQRARRALPRGRALLARHAPGLGGRRRALPGPHGLRPPPRLLPGRDGLGRAQGARDADHLRARGLPARARTRARSATRCRTGRWTRASPSAR